MKKRICIGLILGILAVSASACTLKFNLGDFTNPGTSKPGQSNQGPSQGNFQVEYSVSDITQMLSRSPIKDAVNHIREDNLTAFNILLQYVDKEVGKGNYSLASLYEVNYTKPGSGSAVPADTYVIKIVAKAFEKEFNELGKDDPTNPYLIMYTLKSRFLEDIGTASSHVESRYPSIVVGAKYAKKVESWFAGKFSNTKAQVWYNPLFSTSGLVKNVNEEPRIDVNSHAYDPTQVYLFAPAGTDTNKILTILRSSKTELQNMGVKGITICLLKKGAQLNEVTVKTNQYSKIIENKIYYDTVKD